MANESSPAVEGTENATTGPTLEDYYNNLTVDNLKKLTAAFKDSVTREAARWDRIQLRTQDLFAKNVLISKQVSDKVPALNQVVEQLKVAVAGQAVKAEPPAVVPQKNQSKGADPVDLATGQLLYNYTDLHIDGAGINFDFTRRYRSQGLYPNGPLGVCWDYSMNLWLREISLVEVVVSSEDFREDHFNYVFGTIDNNPYFAPPDGYHAILEKTDADTYVLTRPDGMTYVYTSLNGTAIYKIARIADRFGNFLSFDYTQQDVTTIIVNDNKINPTRVVSLQFDELQRISQVTDYSGRFVTYTYDDYDDLTCVTLPATKAYQFGRSFFYEYSSEEGPVAHQLLSVSDADGRRYLEIEYGQNENFVENERVIRQRDDEGEWLLEYASLFPDDPSDITQPNRYTMMVKPSGHCIEYWLNKNGNALVSAETVYDEDGIKRQFITRCLYNTDGNLIARLSPEKNLVQYIYGRDFYEAHNFPDTIPTREQRKTFGNLLTVIKKADGGFGIDFDLLSGEWSPPLSFTVFSPDDIITDYTYEPVFQLPATRSDPRFRFTAAYFTKYQYTAKGEFQQIIYPQTSGPDPAVATKSGVIDFFEYDPAIAGRVLQKSLKQIDPVLGLTDHPDSHLTTYTYFKNGYLSAVTLGKGEPNEATTSFEVNARGVHTKVIDALKGFTVYDVDATDQPVSVTRNLSAAVSYQTDYKYTREGKVSKSTRQVLDQNGVLLQPDPETTHNRYNDFGLMISQRLGGSDFSACLITQKVYNAEGLPARLVSPGRSVTAIRYDPRRLPIQTTKGFGKPEAVTTKIKYNGDRQQRATEDGAGNVVRYDYDAFGRFACVVQVVDTPAGVPDSRKLGERQGNTHIFIYDKLDNVIEERFFEWMNADTYRLLSFKQFEFDQRGRKIRTIAHLFDPPAPVHTGVNWFTELIAAAIPASIPVESWTFYDGNGKVKEQREGVVTLAGNESPGSSVVSQYDHSGRKTSQATRLLDKDYVVTESKSSYDLNGNLIRSDRYDYQYNTGGALINTEIISAVVEYDRLNRKIKEIDGLGNETTYQYDSRDALISKKDPAGNVTIFEYDIYGRKVKMDESPSAGQIIRTSFEYDADGQLLVVARGDAALNNAVKTTFEYNAVHQKIKKILAAGSPLARSYTYVYDQTGLLKQTIMPNLFSATFSYNRMNQVVQIDYDNSNALAILSDKAELFAFDGMGRMTKATNDSSEVRNVYDSFGRITREEQEFFGSSVFTVQWAYDFLGNYKQLMYPSGRTLAYKYDLAGRQLQISDIKRGLPNVTRPGPGSRVILDKTFIGMRERTVSYGNGLSTLYDYDRAGRVISIGHLDNVQAPMLQLVHLYDQNGNMGADWEAGSESAGGSWVYNYDGLNRLVKTGKSITPFPVPLAFAPVNLPGQPLNGQVPVRNAIGNLVIPAASTEPRYSYDDWSNRLSEKSSVINDTEQFDDLGRLKDPVNIDYDFNGNLVRSGTRIFKYNQHNCLVGVTDGVLSFKCGYDAKGRRILTDDGNNTARLAYEGLTEIASYTANDILNEEFVLGSQPDGRVAYASGNKDYFIHHDLVGSTRMITGSTGLVEGRYDYEPYGRRRTDIVKDFPGFRYLFMGRDWDAAIQLYHFRARHYDLEKGRFLQNDPVENQDGKSLFQAFGSNPLIFIDPLGTREKYTFGSWKDNIQGLQGGELKLKPWGINMFHEPVDPDGNRESTYLQDDPNQGWFRYFANENAKHPSALNEIYGGSALISGIITDAVEGILAPVGRLMKKLDGDGSIGMTIASTPELGPALAGVFQELKFIGLSRYTSTAFAEFTGAQRVPYVLGTLKAGESGVTTYLGDITIQRGLSRLEFAKTLRHESIHRWLSPLDGAFARVWRADKAHWLYENSQLMKYAEEALAETYATKSLRAGMALPLDPFYKLTSSGVLKEAGIVSAGYILGLSGSIVAGEHLGLSVAAWRFNDKR